MAKNKYIETPDKMWELFLSYQEQTKSSPKLVHDFVGKDGNSVFREKEIPLTLEGFENYVADIPEMPMDLGDYFANTNKAYSQYSTICTRIRRKIRQDQIEGGMSSVFNSSITQRLNNLVDKQESTVKVEQPLFGDE
jgi:hypothetical protein